MRRNGFTLIELLIVVAIIGILAAIAIPNFNAAATRAKVSESMAEMRSIETALELYRVDYGDYPPGSPGFTIPTPDSLYNWRLRRLTTPVQYLTSLPMDPFNVGFPDEYSSDRPGMTTYDYNSKAALIFIWTGLGRTVAEAEQTWLDYYGPSDWKLVGIGPNSKFAVDDWGGRKYDPTNGTHSDGDIVLTQAIRFPGSS